MQVFQSLFQGAIFHSVHFETGKADDTLVKIKNFEILRH